MDRHCRGVKKERMELTPTVKLPRRQRTGVGRGLGIKELGHSEEERVKIREAHRGGALTAQRLESFRNKKDLSCPVGKKVGKREKGQSVNNMKPINNRKMP